MVQQRIPRKRNEPPRVRGYYIKYSLDTDKWTTHKVFIWYPEPDLPPEWNAIKNNPHVIDATLIRSGKKYATYYRS